MDPILNTNSQKVFFQTKYRKKLFKTSNSVCNLLQPIKIKNLAQVEWHQIDKAKMNLKAMLPMLDLNEVKRFYLPPCERTIFELQESGLQDAAYNIKELLNFDEERRKEAGPGTLIWKQPRLKDEEELLMHLKEDMIAVEEAKNIGQLSAEVNAWINAALFFQSKDSNWNWITEQLYKTAFKVAESIENDNGEKITTTRYLYGRFLLEKMRKNWELALDYLNDARKTSEYRTWNASKLLGVKQETIFKESNILIYKALISLVQNASQNCMEFAIEACKEALKRAIDSGHDDHIAKTLYELGKNHLRIGNVNHALKDFSKLLAIAKRIPDPESICNAHMELAFAYKKIEDATNTKKHLHLFRENAAKYRLTYKLAQAHYYTGEYFLNQIRPDIATSHLQTAFDLYNNLGLIDETNRARIITGVSTGQERIKEYLNLVVQCENNPETISKLCHWKNDREIFWSFAQSIDDEDYGEEYLDNRFQDSSSSSYIYQESKQFNN